MYIGWTASEVTPGVMVSMCVRSVGICVYRYNVHEMGGGGGGVGGRDVWGGERGEVWREGEKIGRVGNDVMLFNVLVGEDSR